MQNTSTRWRGCFALARIHPHPLLPVIATPTAAHCRASLAAACDRGPGNQRDQGKKGADHGNHSTDGEITSQKEVTKEGVIRCREIARGDRIVCGGGCRCGSSAGRGLDRVRGHQAKACTDHRRQRSAPTQRPLESRDIHKALQISDIPLQTT